MHSPLKARGAALTAGDPDGEVTVAWVTTQQVMDLYQQDDPGQGAHRRCRADRRASGLPNR